MEYLNKYEEVRDGVVSLWTECAYWQILILSSAQGTEACLNSIKISPVVYKTPPNLGANDHYYKGLTPFC